MIFPASDTSSTPAAPLLRRVSALRNEASAFYAPMPVPEIYAVPALPRRNFPRSSFAAQLLALGLRYGIADLINKGEEAAPALNPEEGTRSYADVQENYLRDAHPALFVRWSA